MQKKILKKSRVYCFYEKNFFLLRFDDDDDLEKKSSI